MPYEVERDVWVAHDTGLRPSYEDAHILARGFRGNPNAILGGVFDGHGGRAVADLAAKRMPEILPRLIDSGLPTKSALENAFLVMDCETVGMTSGSVAVVFLLDYPSLVFANAGDSELLLVSRSRHVVLTELHRLSNENEWKRVIAAGGEIRDPYVVRHNGSGLMCTRSLGDHDFKDIGIIANPFVGSVRLEPEDLWLIAACDGLWDVMLPEEVAAVARKMSTARAVAEALRHEALIERRTEDNLTVLVVRVALR